MLNLLEDHAVVVLGGAHLDRRGRIGGQTVMGASNPGSLFEEAGGGGFNAARNLARLGAAVTMVSPRGGDAAGEMVAQAALDAGVTDKPFVFLDRRTPSYTAILEADGNLVIAIADMDLYRLFGPRRVQQRQLREQIAAADALLTDANLPAETLSAALRLAEAKSRIKAGIAISPAKVLRFQPSLDALDLLFMNRAEAAALVAAQTGLDGEADGAGIDPASLDPASWPARLSALGLKGGVVTSGAGPVIAFSQGQAVLLQPPKLPALADVTGAGDSLAAGFLAARLAGLDLGQSLRHGVAASLVTLASPLAVSSEMSQLLLARALAHVPDVTHLPPVKNSSAASSAAF
ncbi:carbohydrate kinase [Rhizobium rhizosphaerae]|uniref:Carbohydrate kinase n=1 Tax=Xaviernesmea rhizosphaerae TaxID=1672749 RepID=A0ABX3PIS5_9HYPH|nr:carbohydrate kinase family protein [Xaviernesmea rhizosphaerae]OQP87996.1 carbohydrate kinase [Xaviernesmea rhizosphaerae]